MSSGSFLASCWINASILISSSAKTEEIFAIAPASFFTFSLKYLGKFEFVLVRVLRSLLVSIKDHHPFATSTKSAITADAVGLGPAPGP